MSSRDSPLGDLKVPLTWTAAIALVVAGVVAIALLLSDRRETFQAEAYGATRRASDTVLTPVGDVMAAPSRWTGAGVDTVRGYFGAVGENQRLRAELKEMRQWRDVAIALRDTNDRYRTILGLRTEPPIPMVAARIVTDSHGPFANTRLANAGKEKGVRTGNPVMSENGLVGRVIGVTTGASRVLLLTDIASRTPVMMVRTNARAILTGDGGPNPRLDYLRGREPVKEGDRVLTSGDGGVLPRGLPVGTAVKGLDGRWRVVLASDRAAIDFVRILLFEDFTQVVNQAELSQIAPPPPTLGARPAGAVAAVPGPPASVKPGVAVSGAMRGATASSAPATPTAPVPVPLPLAQKPAAPGAAHGGATAPLTSAKLKPPAVTPPTAAAGAKPVATKLPAPKPSSAKLPAPKPLSLKPGVAPPIAPPDPVAEPPH